MAQRNWTSLVLTVDVLKQNGLNKIQYKHYYRIMNVTFNLYSVPPPPSAMLTNDFKALAVFILLFCESEK